MSQTSVIAGSLIVAFVVFITVRGELPYYLAVFSGTSPAPSGGTDGTAKSASSGDSSGIKIAGRPILGGDSLYGINIGWGDDAGGMDIPGIPASLPL